MATPPTQPAKAFLGVGWAFAVALDGDGTLAMAAYEEDVRQAILIILETSPGERVMRPRFGAGLNTFVFMPLNTTTMTAVRRRVEDAIIDWEPRVDVEEVSVTADATEAAKLLIELRYRVRATNNVHNLVYPFYLDEGGAE